MASKYYPRWQENNIRRSLKTRRIILLSGPRQCGKTTLAQRLSDRQTLYRNLDDLTLFDAAQNSPESFIKHGKNLMIIDEIQRVPELIRAIKSDVDRDNTPGRYLLTGSSNIQTSPQVQESLAGRVRKIRLRPLSVGEFSKTPPTFLEKAFKEQFENSVGKSVQSKDDYLSLAFKGGYPEPLRLSEKYIRQWHKDYITSLLERDLKDIVNVRRRDSMLKLLEALAALSSKLINVSNIGTGLSIQRPTIESYINALETLYLVERLRPWTKTDSDRIGRTDKFFMTDTGLMASLLKWNLPKVRLDGDKNGKLLETFVFNQLTALIESRDTDYEIYHYRDRTRHEIDFLIENEEGNYLGLEVKSGTRLGKESFKHLKWFKENRLSGQLFIGIILYTGRNILHFGDKMWAIPMNSLWK